MLEGMENKVFLSITVEDGEDTGVLDLYDYRKHNEYWKKVGIDTHDCIRIASCHYESGTNITVIGVNENDYLPHWGLFTLAGKRLREGLALVLDAVVVHLKLTDAVAIERDYDTRPVI